MTIEEIAKELDLPVNVVEKTYKAFWLCIRKHIEDLPLKEDLTEEEFSKLTTSFNIPSLGKLACPYDKYKRVKAYVDSKKN